MFRSILKKAPFIIMVALLFGFAMNHVANADNDPLTRAQMQEAVAETAWSLYWKAEQAQYDSALLTSFSNKQEGAMMRLTLEVPPEYATSDTTLYSVCSGFVYTTYYNALKVNGQPFRINGNYIWYSTTNMFDLMDSSATILRWAKDSDALSRFNNANTWTQYTSYTTYENLDNEGLWTWFSNNWETVLQPGDIMITFKSSGGHATMYIGNGMLIESAGSKYSNGTDSIEGDGTYNLYSVYDFYVSGVARQNNLYDLSNEAFESFCILRPLNLLVDGNNNALSGVELSDSAKARLKYPGLEIDRTVNITPYGTAVYGEDLTYCIKLTNNSNSTWQGWQQDRGTRDSIENGIDVNYTSWYSAQHNLNSYAGQTFNNIVVTETIPSGTTLVSGSITNNGSYDSNTGIITWNVTLSAGSDISLEYSVTVTASRGSIITNDNGTVDLIPSNSISNLVGGDKLDENSSIALYNQYRRQYVSLLDSTDTDFAEDFYANVFGKALSLPSAYSLITDLFDPITSEMGYSQALVNAGLQVLSLNSQYGGMLVKNYYGGRKIHSTMDALDRILEFRTSYLEPGDIIIKAKLGTNTTSKVDVLIYLGNDKFTYYTGTDLMISDAKSLIINSLSYDVFFVLRPSQIYDDINIDMTTATRFIPVQDGGSIITRDEYPADREDAIVETAYAYYQKGSLLQFDTAKISSNNNRRQTWYVSPEEITGDTPYYGDLRTLIFEIYKNALNYSLANTPWLFHQMNITVMRDNYGVYEWEYENGGEANEFSETNFFATLRPGDIVYTDSLDDITLYLGNDEFLYASGIIYDNTTGIDSVETNGMAEILSFEDISSNLTAVYIMRPLQNLSTDENYITDSGWGRIDFPHMDIDKSVNISSLGTTYQGGTLTYTVSITNNSTSAYSSLPIKEYIPLGTSILNYSTGGTYNSALGTINWSINVPAGMTVSVSFSVTITRAFDNTVIDNFIVSEDGTVASIPTKRIENRVGGVKLTTAAINRFASLENILTVTASSDPALYALATRLTAMNNITNSRGIDQVRAIYYWAITGSVSTKNRPDSSGKLVPGSSQLIAEAIDSNYGYTRSTPASLVNRIIMHTAFSGGYSVTTNPEIYNRVFSLNLSNLEIGDILMVIAPLTEGASPKYQYYIFLGNGKFCWLNPNTKNWPNNCCIYDYNQDSSFIEGLFKSTVTYFTLIRPTLGYSNIVTGAAD